MSITFYPLTKWEMVEYPCALCPGAKCTPGNPDPDYAEPFCDGADPRPNVPVVNYANANARAVLRLLGLSPDDTGQVSADQLPEIQRALTAARNSRKRRVPHDAPAYDVGGPGQARVIYSGNTDEQTRRRLDQFQEFLSYCRYHAVGFYWA